MESGKQQEVRKEKLAAKVEKMRENTKEIESIK